MRNLPPMALLALIPGFAQATPFIAPFAGYGFGTGDIELSRSDTGDEFDLGIDEKAHGGIMLGASVDDTGTLYLLYSHQSTRFSQSPPDQPGDDTLAVDYLHLGGSRYYPRNAWGPYVSGSLGLTQLRPDSGSSDSRFSLGVGAGLEYRLTPTLALFAEIRGMATFTDSSGSLVCRSEGCLWRVNTDLWWQGQANLGLSLSF
ncbi:porin family protein [Ferrimonas sediminicola]|uniref:Porin family protein n=1 Tax=Ferrimonas sediminicola TaxID=2569538 RepID=A0A4U1BFB7_9GAMM|nr:outer membrane beta-barrel protein [Ferrimonas sediminicola]TKB49807.1 porin family protein [Ferrimonas sediminicola]